MNIFGHFPEYETRTRPDLECFHALMTHIPRWADMDVSSEPRKRMQVGTNGASAARPRQVRLEALPAEAGELLRDLLHEEPGARARAPRVPGALPVGQVHLGGAEDHQMHSR